MTKRGFLFTTLAALCFLIAGAEQAAAQIKLSGLKEHQPLKSYLAGVVKDKYESRKGKGVRVSSFRAELEKALHARGYYAPRVTPKKDGEIYEFQVKPGPLYHISEIRVEGYAYEQAFSIESGDALIAQDVLNAQGALLNEVMENNCYYNLQVSHRVVLDHDAHIGRITFVVEGEENAAFGAVSFEGADKVSREYLRRFIQFDKGACWNPAKVEASKAALFKTGLISTIDLDLPEELPEDRAVPLHFKLKERAPRRVKLGGRYNTSEGPGVSAEWEHKNFFGAGEKVTVSSVVSMLKQSLEGEYIKPFLWSEKNTLRVSSGIKQEETEAYEEQGIHAGVSLERLLSETWTGSAGVALETSKITDEDGVEETYGLLSFPGSLNFDNRENPLDPHGGYNFSISSEPFLDVLGQSDPFLKTRVSAATYFDLGPGDLEMDPVIALRASVGTITGAETENIPPTKRFFAGGGGSIRGFGYQEASPKDGEDDPIGGRSVIEGGAELRLKFTEKIGGVAFVDAGGAYESMAPDFEGGVHVGAGLGVRYFTSFGPLRLDIATPVNKREETDQIVQVYISIGQAF